MVWHTTLPRLVSTAYIHSYFITYVVAQRVFCHFLVSLHLDFPTSVQALFDSCHSGTLLDLPHYHCNTIYALVTHARVQHIGDSYTSMDKGMRGLSGIKLCIANQDVKDQCLSRFYPHSFSWHPRFIYEKWRDCGQMKSLLRQFGRLSWLSF